MFIAFGSLVPIGGHLLVGLPPAVESSSGNARPSLHLPLLELLQH
jgi:hypothetical protein